MTDDEATTDEADPTDDADGAVRGLGEVALRTEDLDAACDFYADVLRLPVLDRDDTSAFFELGTGYGGHTEVLALFDRTGTDGYEPPATPRTTLDHLAFEIDRADFDAERERLESLGYDLDTAYHDWVQWRSLYLRDPDGNRVELVCYDPED
ncbi:VOC family protein [Halorussus sp. AFM4]|uniref:VOC family protein n=1 Tax=Halorussus sp. AFM4 TaxID=3421651 RepID=UPI003EBC943E